MLYYQYFTGEGQHIWIAIMVITNHHLPSLLLRSHSMAQWERVEGIHVTGGLWLFLRSAVPLEKQASEGLTRWLSTVNTTSTWQHQSQPSAAQTTPPANVHCCQQSENRENTVCLISIGQGMGGARAVVQKHLGTRRDLVYGGESSLVKAFMVWLGPELLASYVYWSPRICKGWEVPPLPISPSAN